MNMKGSSIDLPTEDYDGALAIFVDAVMAFCQGQTDKGDQLLSRLDVAAINRDRQALHALARSASPPAQPPVVERSSKTVSQSTQDAVQRRDRFHCRFTGRRLVDTRIFREVARISNCFHVDEHHSVRETRRGPGGHRMVRSHAAAYEHVVPHSCGGISDPSNIVHTSFHLNESKGAKILPQVPVPEDKWNGLLEYLPALRSQGAALSSNVSTPLTTIKATSQTLHSIPSSDTSDGSADAAFQAAFKRFWVALMEERSSGREVIFTPHSGNPRRITRITSEMVYLAETTERAGASNCGRIELRSDFAKLVRDPTWRNTSLKDVRSRHGIKNLIEFKRDMFERFEQEFLNHTEQPGR